MSEPIAWRWKFDDEGNWHYGDSRPGKFRFNDPIVVEPLYDAPKATPVSSSGGAVIAKIAQVATAVGMQANEPAMELAGQIVSILAANPEHIDRFMAEGSGLFIDGTFDHAAGSLTYRSIGGDILSPSVLRQAKGSEQ